MERVQIIHAEPRWHADDSDDEEFEEEDVYDDDVSEDAGAAGLDSDPNNMGEFVFHIVYLHSICELFFHS